jgi:ABC-type multidrug transport system permease subunit
LDGGLYAGWWFWATILLAPAILGFALAQLRMRRIRRAMLAALAVAPLTIYTAVVFAALAADPSWFSWYVAGLALISVPTMLLVGAALVGYRAGRSRLGDPQPRSSARP